MKLNTKTIKRVELSSLKAGDTFKLEDAHRYMVLDVKSKRLNMSDDCRTKYIPYINLRTAHVDFLWKEQCVIPCEMEARDI